MQLSEFDYYLPPELIAQTPLEHREHSRLLLLNKKNNQIKHQHFFDLPHILSPNDVLVFNDSKVIPARLFTKEGHEIFLLKNTAKTNQYSYYECLVKPGKKFKLGTVINMVGNVPARVIEIKDNIRILEFNTRNFKQFLTKYGHIPLPPYIKSTNIEAQRYQTIYSNREGSVAAPTAGLHFSHHLIKKLQEKGIKMEFITLHIGLGTFLPVKTMNIKNHQMHSESFILPTTTANNLNKYKQQGKRIIAVGTTVARALEYCAQQKNNQFNLIPQQSETNIFIYPGYKFHFIDSLITNFHLPKSTLLMLVSAMTSKDLIFHAYNEAISLKYRFYSFGDAMMIF
jgi:S-adenosylmethionine:tRNA ribosyltransferase-isomerase